LEQALTVRAQHEALIPLGDLLEPLLAQWSLEYLEYLLF
jgi:hypothetical protein